MQALIPALARRSMFVADRSFYVVDPARIAVPYERVLPVAGRGQHAAVTVFNGALVLLIIYSMLGLRPDARAVALSTALAGIHSLVAVQVRP